MREKHGSSEAVAIIQVKLTWKKWSYPEYILKVELLGFLEGFLGFLDKPWKDRVATG